MPGKEQKRQEGAQGNRVLLMQQQASNPGYCPRTH